MDKTYHLISADGKRILQANDAKSTRGWQVRAQCFFMSLQEDSRSNLYTAALIQKPRLRLSFSLESCATPL